MNKEQLEDLGLSKEDIIKVLTLQAEVLNEKIKEDNKEKAKHIVKQSIGFK